MIKVLFPFIALSFISSASANELTLLFIKSPGIDWDSPRTLAQSTVAGIRETYGLGHVNIRIACNGKEEVLTGIYNRYAGEPKRAARSKGYGLGVLFSLFEGNLQNPKFIASSFGRMAKDGRANFVTFRLNPATCLRVLDYHNQYVQLVQNRKKKVRIPGRVRDAGQQVFYGFPAIPRLGEGGGCSAFAISFLEVAGIKEQWMVDEWTQSMLVPKETVGTPIRDTKVSLTSMYLSGPKRWAKETEDHYPFFFWDPDKMIRSTRSKLKSESFIETELYGANGYILDRTHIPTPSEPLFLNDPVHFPTDPRIVYDNIEELLKRYEILKSISYPSEAPLSSSRQ